LKTRNGHADVVISTANRFMPLDQYLAKLRQVLATRRDLFVIARTDSSEPQDIERRVIAFAEAGADAVLVDGLKSLETVRQLSGIVPRPFCFNQIAQGKSPPCTLTELRESGAKLVIYSTPCLFAAQAAIGDAMLNLVNVDGSLAGSRVGVKDCTRVLSDNLARRSAPELIVSSQIRPHPFNLQGRRSLTEAKMSHEPICASGADQSREQTAIRNLVADGGLWLAMVLSLQAFRVLMLVLFRDEVSPETGLTQILRCIGTGLRFDVSMASYAILPTLALTLVGFFRPLGALHGRVRWTLAGVLTSVSLITFVVDVGYFQEYHDQFNHWIFGLLYDDNAAIAQTIWKSYPVVWLLVLTVVVTAVVILAGRALWGAVVSRVKLRGSWAQGRGRYFAPVVILIVLALGLRGFIWQPADPNERRGGNERPVPQQTRNESVCRFQIRSQSTTACCPNQRGSKCCCRAETCGQRRKRVSLKPLPRPTWITI
jgi:hypothetical protein